MLQEYFPWKAGSWKVKCSGRVSQTESPDRHKAIEPSRSVRVRCPVYHDPRKVKVIMFIRWYETRLLFYIGHCR
jgi:hypothetical protein